VGGGGKISAVLSSYIREWKDRYLKSQVWLVIWDVISVRMGLHFGVKVKGQFERKRL
jgi:hypothetical protein